MEIKFTSRPQTPRASFQRLKAYFFLFLEEIPSGIIYQVIQKKRWGNDKRRDVEDCLGWRFLLTLGMWWRGMTDAVTSATAPPPPHDAVIAATNWISIRCHVPPVPALPTLPVPNHSFSIRGRMTRCAWGAGGIVEFARWLSNRYQGIKIKPRENIKIFSAAK